MCGTMIVALGYERIVHVLEGGYDEAEFILKSFFAAQIPCVVNHLLCLHKAEENRPKNNFAK